MISKNIQSCCSSARVKAPALLESLDSSAKDDLSGAASRGEVNCPVAAAIQLIGGKYKALILWQLSGGILRFSELGRAIAEATPKMLTQQLRELEADGLIERKVYPVVPPRVEYFLTAKGQSLRPVLVALYHWGSGHLQEQGKGVNCSMTPPED